MPFTYTFSKIDKLGDLHETYGQAYWASVNETLTPVKFNSQNENIGLEDTIECEEQAEKKSAKGTVYLQLKKVRVVSDQIVKTNDPRIIPSAQSQLDRVEALLLEIDSKLDKVLYPEGANHE